MVTFTNDLDTFCKYVVYRRPNVDGVVRQYLADRHLEKAVRGMYYLAHYRHQPDDGEAITVTLDQFCGRVDPDTESNAEAVVLAETIAAIDRRVTDAVAAAGAEIHKEGVKYTGEIVR